MDIKAGKLNIIQQLLNVDDELLLEAIQELLDYVLNHPEKSNKDFWDELTEAQKAQIETSRQQHLEGKGIPHNQVMEVLHKNYGS